MWCYVIPKEAHLQGVALRLNSNVYLYAEMATVYTLYETYSIKAGPMVTQYVGRWSQGQGLSIPEPNVHVRRSNLRGIEIVNAVKTYSPYHDVISFENGEAGLGGVFGDYFAYLAMKLNFTIVIVEPPDDKWGGLEADGVTWNGIVRMLLDGEADMSTTLLTRVEQRQAAVDFSAPMLTSQKTLLARADGGGTAMQFWVYVDIFSPAIWGICCTLLTGLGVAFFCIERSGLHNFHDSSDSEKFTLLNALSLPFLFSLQLSYGNLNTPGLSARTLSLTLSFISYLMFSYYTCDLTSRMTSGSVPEAIISFQDVLDKDYRVLVEEGTANSLSLRNATEGSAMRRVHDEIMLGDPSAFVPSIADGLDLVLTEEKTLFFGSEVTATKRDGLLMALPLIDSFPSVSCWTFPKGSELAKLFDYHLFAMEENGLKKRMYNVSPLIRLVKATIHNARFCDRNTSTIRKRRSGFPRRPLWATQTQRSPSLCSFVSRLGPSRWLSSRGRDFMRERGQWEAGDGEQTR